MQDYRDITCGWFLQIPMAQMDTTRRMVFRFTDLAVGQGCVATVLSVAGAAPFAEVTFQDCHVRGGLVSVFLVQVNGPRNIRWVNNVWERATPRVFYYAGNNPSPYHQHPVTVDCRNNLFRDSYLPLVYQAANGTAGIWEVKDNLFDQTGNVATTDSAGAVLLQRSHNAATAGTVNNLGGTWYRTDLERDYVSGPRGEYYHPESGGAYSLAQLRDAGSRSALQAGLACASTRTDHQPDEGTVDIGFHYRFLGEVPAVGDLSKYVCSGSVVINLEAGVSSGCIESYEITGPPQSGNLSGNPPIVVYHPLDFFEGQDSFKYKVANGASGSEEATVWLTVANPPPTAEDMAAKTCQNTPVVIILRGSDPCPEPITFFGIVDPPAHGDLGPITLLGGSTASVSYTPNNPAFTGQDQFTYRVRDRWRYSEPATVAVTIGQAPVAHSLNRFTHLGCPIEIVLTAEGCEGLTFSLESQPTKGILCGEVPNLTYTPFSVGTDQFTFKVTDEVNESLGSVFIEIRPSDDQALWTDSGVTAEQLAEWLSEPADAIANVAFTGAMEARGIFGGGLSAGLPFDEGVMLSTGSIHLAVGPNHGPSSGIPNGSPPDQELDALLDTLETETDPLLMDTMDAAVLEFDLTPSTTVLQFDYVFASEEYPEFIGNLKNDAVAIFVNGQNVAWIPGTMSPVCVFTVHAARNSAYFQCNLYDCDRTFNFEFDGFTSTATHPWLTATTPVQPGVSVHVKIVIADEDDPLFDSAVFMRAKRPLCAAPCP